MKVGITVNAMLQFSDQITHGSHMHSHMHGEICVNYWVGENLVDQLYFLRVGMLVRIRDNDLIAFVYGLC